MSARDEATKRTDMTCEAHPLLPWPHDDCLGPGMPWQTGMGWARDRLAHAARLLDLWADAIRGDWGGIDGRQCRTELNRLTDYMRGQRDKITAADIGVCDKGGGGHWPEWCDGHHDPVGEE